jgi:RNase H-fold protein (predicted Holliday junction resolvase)
MWRNRNRTIGIDPTPRGYGFAVLEGPARLVDFGTTAVPNLKTRGYVERVEALIERYDPSVMVLENPHGKGSRRSKRVARVIRELETLAWRRHVKVRRVSRAEVRAVFNESGWRKGEIASTLTGAYPALEDILPPKRRPWEAEREGMAVYDALSFALTGFGPEEGEVR